MLPLILEPPSCLEQAHFSKLHIIPKYSSLNQALLLQAVQCKAAYSLYIKELSEGRQC